MLDKPVVKTVESDSVFLVGINKANKASVGLIPHCREVCGLGQARRAGPVLCCVSQQQPQLKLTAGWWYAMLGPQDD